MKGANKRVDVGHEGTVRTHRARSEVPTHRKCGGTIYKAQRELRTYVVSQCLLTVAVRGSCAHTAYCVLRTAYPMAPLEVGQVDDNALGTVGMARGRCSWSRRPNSPSMNEVPVLEGQRGHLEGEVYSASKANEYCAPLRASPSRV